MSVGGIDWKALGDETVELLRRYLTIDTTNPPGNEMAGARFLAEVLAAERHRERDRGVGARPRQSGRAAGRRRLAGRHRAPPPHRRRLRRPPLLDGRSVRRRRRRRLPLRPRRARHEVHRHPAARRRAGAQAGAGAAQARPRLPGHRRRGGRQRATAPASSPSSAGRGWPAPSTRSPSWPASSTTPATAPPLGVIVISEKTGLPLRLTARGEPGHGSMPWPDTAPHRLVRALDRLLAAERPPRVLPEVQEYFRRVGRGAAGGRGAGLRRPRALAARAGLPRALPGRPLPRRHRADHLRRRTCCGAARSST